MVHSIHTDDDYEQAREEIARLAESDLAPDSPQAERLAMLRGLVAAYLEARTHAGGHPDSSEALDVHADLSPTEHASKKTD